MTDLRERIEAAIAVLREKVAPLVATDRAVADAVMQVLREQEPVGEVVLFGSELKEVAWRAGKMPQVGTKLYAAAPKPGEKE